MLSKHIHNRRPFTEVLFSADKIWMMTWKYTQFKLNSLDYFSISIVRNLLSLKVFMRFVKYREHFLSWVFFSFSLVFSVYEEKDRSKTESAIDSSHVVLLLILNLKRGRGKNRGRRRHGEKSHTHPNSWVH